jgi:hypothetical protein
LTTPKDKDTWREQKRREIAAASVIKGRNNHLGLLSVPAFNCVGDDFDSSRKANRPISGTYFKSGGQCKRGQVGSGCYFSSPVPLCVEDPYKDATARSKERRLAKTRFYQEEEDIKPFRPSGSFKPGDGPFLLVVDKDSGKEEVKEIAQMSRSK